MVEIVRNERYKRKNNFKKNKQINSVLKINTVHNRSEKLITFLIPTFNRVSTLKNALDSIINLKKLNSIDYEILIIDNSANLNDSNVTFQFLKTLTIPNLKYYINEKNIGMEGNWNRGFELSNSKLVSMLHDDDLLNHLYLEEMIEILKQVNIENLGFIKPIYQIFHNDNEIFDEKIYQKKKIKKIKKIDCIIEGIGSTYTPSCGLIFNKNNFIKTGGFDSGLYPSSDHIIGFIELEMKFDCYITTNTLGYYRIGMNESMKIDTIFGFVKKDDYIRKYMYNTNFYYKIFLFLFDSVQYKRKIDFWIAYAYSNFNLELKIKDLDYKNSYKNNILLEGVYNIVYAFNRLIIKFFR